VASWQRLVSKYLGMDPVQGRAQRLFFLSWLENVRYAIEQQIPVIHMGATAEKLKAKLGGVMIPSVVAFKHQHALLNRFFSQIKDQLAYEPEVDVPAAQLGSAWAGKAQTADVAYLC
jgi:hypothetical protein